MSDRAVGSVAVFHPAKICETIALSSGNVGEAIATNRHKQTVFLTELLDRM